METFMIISLVVVIIGFLFLFSQPASQSGNVYILIALILIVFFLLMLDKRLDKSFSEDSVNTSIDVQEIKHKVKDYFKNLVQ